MATPTPSLWLVAGLSPYGCLAMFCPAIESLKKMSQLMALLPQEFGIGKLSW